MPKSTQLIPEPAVKETYIVYISERMLDPGEFQETEIRAKKRNPKKHAKRKELERLLRFPELVRRFYYHSVYVTKLKVGNQTIELRSGKVNKSKEYEV